MQTRPLDQATLIAPWRRPALLLILAGGALLSGCDKAASPAGGGSAPAATSAPSTNAASTNAISLHDTNQVEVLPGMQASPLESANVERAFVARGIIRELPAGGTTVTIKHEDIPGFMPKMTMEFDVRNTNELRGLKVGDAVTFQIKATQIESWIEGLHRTSSNDLASAAKVDPSSASILHVADLKNGDLMPDAELVGEDGNVVHFSAFRGKAVAFTFMFTRCPLPDYCPRMSRHFGAARELLLQSATAPLNWQFISISFDPEFDQPGVLNRYAFSYRGSLTNQWLFASAPKDALKTMSKQLDFRFANENGSFQHNLRTVVLDAQGRVFRAFEGNKWTPEQLAEAMTAAANPTPKATSAAK